MLQKRIFISSVVFLHILLFASFSDKRKEVSNLRYYSHPTHTRIVVDMEELREYSFKELPAPDRIYVDIYQARLNPLLHNKTFSVSNEYITQVRIAQTTSSTVRVVVDLDFSKIKRYHVWHIFDPFRVVVDIYPTLKIPEPPQPAKEGYSMARQLGLGIKTIVLDPGHGGKDPGCIGKNGLQEKEIVLDVCLRLKKLFEERKDLETILTREKDIFIPLEQRTVIANQKRADLFISIHVNSSYDKRRSGVETFYLNFSHDPSVNEIAARENATSTKNINEMKLIIEKIIQNSKIVESKELAERIQKNMIKTLSKKYPEIRSLGVKGGPFWVLIGGEMPSILIEISHLSNPKESELLKTQEYREQISRGVYEGILEYIQSLGKG